MTRLETNFLTGEVKEIKCASYLLADGTIQIIDDGAKVPKGAVLAPTGPDPVQVIAAYTAAAQRALDAGAKSWGYDDMRAALSYLTSTVKQWAAEAAVLNAWRDAFWMAAHDVQTQVQSGALALPATADDFVALLPPLPARPVVK